MSIEITRGFDFRIQVDNEYCQLILKSDTQKINITTIKKDGQKYYLEALAPDTKKYRAGEYKYQIIDNTKIVSEGNAVIRHNFALVDQNASVKTHNEVILEAIEAQIAGVASSAQTSIHVGDKSISYMSFDQLMKAREFFKKKVAEQKKTHVAGNQGRIVYKWSL